MAEKKEYRSALRSRRMIRQAFLDLLREKSFEKITVTDIVKRADINRSTFYAHYPDVRGLVEDMINDTIDRSMALIADVNIQDILEDPMPFLRSLVIIGEDNMDVYRLLGKSDFALRQIESMKSVLLEKAVNAVDIPECIRSSIAFHIQINFFIGGIINTYQQWLQGMLDCSTEDIMEQLAHLMMGLKPLYPELNRM